MRPVRTLLSILFFSLFTLALTPSVHAAGEFQTDYKVTYSIDQNGKTSASEDIVLKNKTPNIYADQFELKIGSTKVENVGAKDSAGPMKTDVKFENNVTTINVKFNQRVIGIDKTLPWSLTYTSGELANKAGQIWEISIPRLAQSPDINSYQATVLVPQSFGPIAFAVPQPQSAGLISQNQQYTFGRDQLFASGIAMSFGQTQVFSLNLHYHIQNNNITTQTEQIALPPDNNYQKIVIDKIDPPPVNVDVDRDGNFLAKYKLKPQTQLEIQVTGYVEVFSKPFRNIDQKLTPQDKAIYTQPDTYWETNNPQIKDKARELKTPQAIYNFVAGYLTYSNNRLQKLKDDLQKQPPSGRLGAAAAFATPKEAVCTEFTDLFIALARSTGIPAREVEGYAYTQNERLRPLSLELTSGDILHAWPEYWDDNLGWVQVDPTWGSTSGGLDYFNKLDFDHITLVQRGASSTFPLPTGAYKKTGGKNKKDIDISFAASLPTPTATPQLALTVADKIISAVPVTISAQIKNLGSASIIGQKLTLSSSKLTPIDKLIRPINGSGENSIDVALLPPYAVRNYDFRFQNKRLFTRTQDNLILSYDDSQISKPVEILPVYNLALSVNFLISMAIASAIIGTGVFIYRRHVRSKKPGAPKIFG